MRCLLPAPLLKPIGAIGATGATPTGTMCATGTGTIGASGATAIGTATGKNPRRKHFRNNG